MFNLPRRIYRLFSWIKTNQNHQNSVVIQEQLGSIVHQEAIQDSSSDSTSLVVALTNNESLHQHGSDESNLITSFNLSTNPNNLNNIETIVNSSSMPYQPQSSLSLLGC